MGEQSNQAFEQPRSRAGRFWAEIGRLVCLALDCFNFMGYAYGNYVPPVKYENGQYVTDPSLSYIAPELPPVAQEEPPAITQLAHAVSEELIQPAQIPETAPVTSRIITQDGGIIFTTAYQDIEAALANAHVETLGDGS